MSGLSRTRCLLVLAVLALAATACGGVENEPNLAKAVERTEAAGSSRIAVSGVEKDEANARFGCEGRADYAEKRIAIRCDYPSGDLQVVLLGDTTYVRGGGFLGAAGDGGKWVRFESEDGDFSLQDFSPEKLLSLLRGASRETERIGEEVVRGESSVGYRLTVDCDEAELDCDGTSPVDVWIDGDGLVRKIELEDDSSKGAIEFFDFGLEVEIERPPAEEVVDESGFGPGGTAAGPVTECSAFQARPISRRAAIVALRRHGFGVDDGTCGPAPGVLTLTNNTGRAPDVLEREGVVICHVLQKPRADEPGLVVTGETLAASSERELANVRCVVFSDKAPAKEKADRLDAAFEELEQAVRP